MKKGKKQKQHKGKKASSKKVAKKKVAPKKKIAKKKVSKKVSKKVVKAKPLSKKAQDELNRLNRLIVRGKEKGFVTFDGILKEFPTIEDNITFLDELYEKLHSAGVDILEGGGLLEIPNEDNDKKYYSKSDSAYDSIQMYLK
jgi:hypothetical protein